MKPVLQEFASEDAHRPVNTTRAGGWPNVIGAQVVASESGAAVSAGVSTSSLVALLTQHIRRDGEVVLLALKPSLWFILFQSMRFIAVVLLLYLVSKVFRESLPGPNSIFYWEAAVLLTVGRLMAATLQWMARWYVLTDQRVIRLWGVFSPQIFDCPLRKVARTQLVYNIRERLWWLGSIEIHRTVDGKDIPQMATWRTIARPREIHEQMVAAVRKAQG